MQTRATDSCHRDPDSRHRRSRRASAALVLLLLAACVPEGEQPTSGKPAPEPTCEVVACRHVADCAPSLTGGVDWRTPEACLASGWECYEPAAATRAWVDVRRACLGPPY